MSVPRDSASICAGYCQAIGMRLGAVAIMADNVGCVCQFAEAGTSANGAVRSAPPVAGMSTILMQQAATRQQQTRQ